MIKWILIAFVFLYPFEPVNAQNRTISSSCTCSGIKLYGKVRIVDNPAWADFKVRVVKSFEDLNVKYVKNFADRCGRWQIVDAFEDFSVYFVKSGEDFKIKEVKAFEGLP